MLGGSTVCRASLTRAPLGGSAMGRASLCWVWLSGSALRRSALSRMRLSRPTVVQPGTSVAEAAERMLELSLQHLPVVDDGRLVGLVDMAAVCRALLDLGRPAGG